MPGGGCRQIDAPGRDRGLAAVLGEDLDQQPIARSFERDAVAFLDNDAGGSGSGDRREVLQARHGRGDAERQNRGGVAGRGRGFELLDQRGRGIELPGGRGRGAKAARLGGGRRRAQNASTRRALSTMSGSILDPLSRGRGRKGERTRATGRRSRAAGRDQAWDE